MISALVLILCFLGIVLMVARPGIPTICCSECGKPMDPWDTPWEMPGFLGHAHCWFLREYPEYRK